MNTEVDVSELLGKTCCALENKEDEELLFIMTDGTRYKMYHDQDCCENVRIEDITGELTDLVDAVLVETEETHQGKVDIGDDGDQEWTFYRFRTAKGAVVIRWYGTSNGYYSTSVEFKRLDGKAQTED